jgi:hypothetical protein
MLDRIQALGAQINRPAMHRKEKNGKFLQSLCEYALSILGANKKKKK